MIQNRIGFGDRMPVLQQSYAESTARAKPLHHLAVWTTQSLEAAQLTSERVQKKKRLLGKQRGSSYPAVQHFMSRAMANCHKKHTCCDASGATVLLLHHNGVEFVLAQGMR